MTRPFSMIGAVASWFIPIAVSADRAIGQVEFKKVVLDRRFVAEGVTVGDVNRDGKLDVMAGNIWYEAPHWTPHEIASFNEVDPKRAYSNCFNSWAEDLDHDGWVDQIVIGMPGEKVVWRENPKGAEGAWKEHLVWKSACNESPAYEDLLGNGKKVLVMGTDDDTVAWFEPSPDPTKPWVRHDVSGSQGAGAQRYSHGLGVGDMNGDHHKDILTTSGYYASPDNPRLEQWTFVPSDLGPDCAQMLVVDVNNDKRPDVLTTSAHARGVWWHESLKNRQFEKHTIDDTISVTHSAQLAVLGQSKSLNLITGKRKWAHPPGVDVGSDEAPVLVRYEIKRDRKGVSWTRHVIDENSGVGTQFVVSDINRDRLQDIIIANKNGVFIFLQLP